MRHDLVADGRPWPVCPSQPGLMQVFYLVGRSSQSGIWRQCGTTREIRAEKGQGGVGSRKRAFRRRSFPFRQRPGDPRPCHPRNMGRRKTVATWIVHATHTIGAPRRREYGRITARFCAFSTGFAETECFWIGPTQAPIHGPSDGQIRRDRCTCATYTACNPTPRIPRALPVCPPRVPPLCRCGFATRHGMRTTCGAECGLHFCVQVMAGAVPGREICFTGPNRRRKQQG